MTNYMNHDATAESQAIRTSSSPRSSRKEILDSLASAAHDRLSNREIELVTRKAPEAILALSPEMNPVTRFMAGRDARAHSMTQYALILKRVQRILVEVGYAPGLAEAPLEKFPWHCVDEAVALRFASLLETRYPNTKSRHNLLGLLREILRQCASVDLISTKDLDSLLNCLPLKGHYQRGRGRVVTDEDSALFLQAGLTSNPRTDLRDRTIIAVFLSTGIRVSELVDIEIDDVDLKPDARSIYIKRNKGGRSLTVYLNDGAAAMVQEWIVIRGSHAGALFDTEKQLGQPLQINSVQQMVIRRRKKAGITTDYSTHDFRRTLATTALRQGVDVFSVQRLLGHTNVQATLIYDRRTEIEDRTAVDSLDIPGLPKSKTKGTR